jgi:hypothetical protein
MDPTTAKFFAGSSGHLDNPMVSITGVSNPPPGPGGGGAGVITWSSNDVTSLNINQGIGSVANSGNQTVFGNGSTVVYTITGTTSSNSTLTSSTTITFYPDRACERDDRRNGLC